MATATPRAVALMALMALLVVLCATRVDAQAARRVGGVARGGAGGARGGVGPRRFSGARGASFGERARSRAGAGAFGARGGGGRVARPETRGAPARPAARRVGPSTPGRTSFATATDPANDQPRRGAVNEAPRPTTTRAASRVPSRAGTPVDDRVATARRDASLSVSSPRPVPPRDAAPDPARDVAFRQALTEAPRVNVRRGDRVKDGEDSDRPTTTAKAATTTAKAATTSETSAATTVSSSESIGDIDAAAIESEPQKVVVGVRLEGDAATTATRSIGSRVVAKPSSNEAAAEDPIVTSGPRPQTVDRPTSFDQQTTPIEPGASAARKVPTSGSGSGSGSGSSAAVSSTPAAASSTPVRPSATPLPASPDPLTGGRAEYPLFGGGLDLGRGYAPRGFGGIPREPECKSTSASSTPRTSRNQRRDQPRAYVVRFFENVTAETFREVSREVEARTPETTNDTTNENEFDEVRAAEAGLPEGTSFPVTPRLRANAPGFRTATLVGLTATQKRAFHRAHASEIEVIEEDAEVFAYASAATTTTRARSTSTCAHAQNSLTASQWNLDRLAHAPTRALPSRLDGTFEPPECLCGRGVHVFVLDTGVRVTHEDFRPPERVGSGWNFVGCGDEVDDQSGHGTHTAGTAVGATSGVAKCATLHPVQILDGEGKGKSSDVLSALDWVADRDVGAGARKVVSMSVGGPRSAAIDAAVREMVAMGVIVVAAAGNEGRDAAAVSPAGEPAAVTVGSTSCPSSGDGGGRCASDAVSGFSNYGRVVDVYAPGEKVRSAWRTSDDAYRVSSGTSMACPLVAGAASLYLEKFPAATPEDVARAIAATATPVTWGDSEGEGGGGMLNLPAMLREAPA